MHPDFYFLDDLAPMIEQELVNPPTGIELLYWGQFNELTGGLRMSELSLLTSGTGTGKTTFLANLAVQATLAGYGSYIASVEIGSVSFLLAMISVLARKDYNTGEKYSESEVANLKQNYLPLLKAGRLVFGKHDNRVAPEVLVKEIITAHEKYGIKFVILDNLQFFSQIVEYERERAEQDRVIREFVAAVKKYPIHIFLIVHTKKDERADNDRVEAMSSIKGSKTICDEAWNVFALNKPKTEDIKMSRSKWTDREIKILKLRKRGRNVGREIKLYFEDGRYGEKDK